MALDAEIVLWPHEAGVDQEPDAAPLLRNLREALDSVPLETLPTPAELGRRLGARVVVAGLSFPRQGWTWYTQGSPLVEVADWLSEDMRQLVAAHEVCHVILGPPSERHDRLTERVCNWGAGVILQRLGRFQLPHAVKEAPGV